MLVLARKIGETIVINDDIYCTILSVHGKQIRLGIEAPESVIIQRKEIYERIQHERMASILAASNGLGLVLSH